MVSQLLKSISDQLQSEVALLLSVLAWLLLRSSHILVKNLSEGKNLKVDLFGKEIVRIDQAGNSNLDLKPTEKNISDTEEKEQLHIQQENIKTQAVEELDKQAKDNLTLSYPMEEQDLSQKNQQSLQENEKEVDTDGCSI
jgi:maltodextrin utilization protein YvdJ